MKDLPASYLHTAVIGGFWGSQRSQPRFCTEVLVFCWGLVTLHLFSQYLCLMISSGKEMVEQMMCKKEFAVQWSDWMDIRGNDSTKSRTVTCVELLKKASFVMGVPYMGAPVDWP